LALLASALSLAAAPDRVRLLSAPFTTNAHYRLEYEWNGVRMSLETPLQMGANLVLAAAPAGGTNQARFEIVRVESMLDRRCVGYDLLDHLQWVTNALGRVTRLTHDGLGRLVEMDGPDTNDTVRCAYDGNDNLTRLEDPTGVTTYAYDDLDRLTRITLPRGRGAVVYGYDPAGRVTSLRYPHGATVCYGYDAAGRLETVADGTNATAYAYYPDGLLKSAQLPNGIVSQYAYDSFARLTDLVHTNAFGQLVAAFHYGMDNNGNRTQVTIRRLALDVPGPLAMVTNVYRYAYDARDQLIRAEHPDGSAVEYTYDDNANRLSRSADPDGPGPLAAAVEYYHYGSENRLDSVTDAGGAAVAQYFYDPMGNLVSRVTATNTVRYSYDSRNLLVQVEDGVNLVRYEYDGNGDRIARILNGARTEYVNDPNRECSQPLLETDGSGRVQAIYVYGLGRVSGLLPGETEALYYLQDALGSTVALANRAGETIQACEYDSFGELRRETTRAGRAPPANELLFGGERLERVTGLHFLRARYYDPGSGRFLSKDPFGFSNGEGPYTYVRNNPIARSDPEGKDWGRLGVFSNGEVWRAWYDGIRGITSDMALQSELLHAGMKETFKRVPLQWLAQPFLTGGRGLRPEYFNATKTASEFLGRLDAPVMLKKLDVLKFADVGLKWKDYYDVSQRWAGGRATMPELLLSGSKAVLETVLTPLKGAFALAAGVGKWAGEWIGNRIPLPASSFRDRLPSSSWQPASGGFGSATDILSKYREMGRSLDRGGVLLNRAAGFVGDLAAITGATVDAETGQVVLLGTNGAGGAVPDLQLADFVTAVRAVFGSAEDPGVTIDPQPGFESNPNVAQLVHLFAGLEDTDMGWVLLEADRVMKTLAAERDNVLGFQVKSSVPGYKSMLQRWLEAAAADGTARASRFWFVPADVRLVRSAETNAFVFDRAAVQLLTESVYAGQGGADTNAEAFAQWFTGNYAAIALEEFAVYRYPSEGVDTAGPYAFRIFQRLEQAAKAIAFARFLYDNRIPIDFSWIDKVKLPGENTPRFVQTVQNERYQEVSGGVVHVVIYGGVSLETPNTYVYDNGAAADLRTNVLASRPGPLAQRWTVNFNGQDQTAVALSLNTRHVDGLDARADTDFACQTPGDAPFGLTRFYRSSEPAPGPFGYGWDCAPMKLEFARPEFFSSSRSLFGFLNGLREGEIRVVNRAGGRTSTFVSTLETERLAGLFFYSGLNADGLPDFSPGGSEAPDGSALAQDPVTLGYRWSMPNGTSAEFDRQGLLLRALDARGRAVSYVYDTNGLLVAIADPLGQTLRLSYDASNRVSRAAGLAGDEARYDYDADGNLAAVTRTREGTSSVTTYQYDTNHALTTVTLPGHFRDSQQVHDLMGRATALLDTRGNQFQSRFDPAAGRTEITDLDNGTSTVEETDFLGRPALLQDALGRQTRYHHFSFNRRQPDVVESPDPQRPLLFFEYDANGNVTEIADPVRGGDADGNGLDDHPVAMVYDARNNLVELRDARGIVTRFGYNEFGQRTWMTRAWGSPCEATTLWNYSPTTGFLMSRTDPSGVTTAFEYDALGNLTAQIVAPGAVASVTNRYFYDAFSRRVAREDGVGRRTSTVFNGRDQAVSTRLEAPSPLISTNLFDLATGRLLAEVDYNGNTNRFSYDPMTGDILRLSESGVGADLAYDRYGDLASITDPAGNTTEFLSDVLRRQTAVISRGRKAAAAPLSISRLEVKGGSIELTVANGVSTNSVVVEQTASLTAPVWTPTPGASLANLGGGVWLVTLPQPSSGQHFYRARVVSETDGREGVLGLAPKEARAP